jgi:Cu2+-exporting ATPase
MDRERRGAVRRAAASRTRSYARRTFGIVRENLAWAFAYNLIAIPAAAFSCVAPLLAALGMSASSLASWAMRCG